MARTISREVASIGIRLVDEAYMSWCTAKTQCQNALSTPDAAELKGRPGAQRGRPEARRRPTVSRAAWLPT
jgi:hypothetical protein